MKELEYRLNFFIDAALQPMLMMIVEVVLWSSVLSYTKTGTLGGFDKIHYVSYALWAVFFSRISANWMYEYMMCYDIEKGRINAFLVRPISFYEYYLAQFLGYKCFTMVISFTIPLGIYLLYPLATNIQRLPLALLLVFCNLIFVFSLSFIVASLTFFYSKASSFTTVKNITLWLLSGELFPLDLTPDPWRSWLIHSPFAAGVYVPVGYLTGRFDHHLLLQTFVSLAVGLAIIGPIIYVLWQRGCRHYSGTGA